MITNFLRPPTSLSEWIADVLRVVGLLGVVVAGIWLSPTDAGILALTLPALVLPRFIGARAGFDIVFSVVVLVAAWSNILDLYRTLIGWDKAIHLLCTAVIAPMVYLLLAHCEIVPRPGHDGVRTRVAVTMSTTIGLAVSAVWEMIEWVGFVVFTDEIYVEYHDTIGDMAIGGLGALLAGFVLSRARLTRTLPLSHR
ncbi:DUF2238 domain-containing protein [Humidisolicoccus flavus]|uniref:DUF2238 domain-containing protein n=1 Tax=Humidisolicoccus flavus TaxID=3111414 RepID=UPI0032513E36